MKCLGKILGKIKTLTTLPKEVLVRGRQTVEHQVKNNACKNT